jgi:hypothetical protein
LEVNWHRECTKFFRECVLRVKELTPSAWMADRSPFTIWVIRVTKRGSTVAEEMLLKDDVSLHAVITDESHSFLRTTSSARAKMICRLFTRGRMVIHLSGTLFPLGVKEDSAATMHNLGGPWVRPPDKALGTNKWSIDQRRTLRQLFKDHDAADARGFHLLKFRIFIAPFTLRRTESSKWDGEFIIKNSHRHPPAIVECPQRGCKQAEAAASTYRVEEFTGPDGEVNNKRLQVHADHVRQLAWSELYSTYHMMTDKGPHRDRYIFQNIARSARSHRMTKLIDLILQCMRNGERFLIATDKVFLIRLTVGVFPHPSVF